MPRKLIIAILVVLILGILGGTAVLVINRLRGSQEEQQVAQQPGELQEGAPGSQQIANPTGDDDNDQLLNADEALWGTSPTNADTDSDGFLDGEEVAANHNPTIPSPNDVLPEGFVPGRDIMPLTAAPTEAVPVDQFFAEGLDLSGGSQNLTEEYQKQYPEDQRTPDTLDQFARAQPIITQLPTPADKAINLLSTDGRLTLGEYLEVAGNLGVFSNREFIAEALNDLYGNEDVSSVRSLALTARLHQQDLLELRVPPSAESLHKLLLSYTELLAATYDMMALYPQDPVKGVVGLYQLEEIDRKYYPLIEQEVDRLTAYQQQLAQQQ